MSTATKSKKSVGRAAIKILRPLKGKAAVAEAKSILAAAVRSRRADRARERRAEDKADIAIATKRLADLDSGKTKARKAEDVWRDLGI